ncbi:alpha/beta fold hydrolase [Williamsia sterculiae]|uniref:alpha/beta fold hydrolase n=1 Tax=Williamsia sterculiae TaxID=1344003 RepID=UPI001F211EEE|nr:alpha/beta fold hydrolase [Williamsia sterculiae]
MTDTEPLDEHAPALAALDRTTALWPGRYVHAAGARVFVRHTSDAPDVATDHHHPILYVHGLGGSSLNWHDLGELLRPFGVGHAMDLPGFGFSEPPAGGRYTLSALIDSVIAVLEMLGGADLVGNSLGGVVVARVAEQRPDLVRTLTLISPAFPDIRPGPRRVTFLPLALAGTPGLGRMVFGYLGRVRAEAQVAQTFRHIMVQPSVVGPVRTAQAVEHATARAAMPWASAALSGSFNTLVASWLRLGGRDHWVRARRIRVPTLVIWGREDQLVSSRLAAKVARTIPGARLVMFDGVGHVSQMEVPERTAELIAAHLKRVGT